MRLLLLLSHALRACEQCLKWFKHSCGGACVTACAAQPLCVCVCGNIKIFLALRRVNDGPVQEDPKFVTVSVSWLIVATIMAKYKCFLVMNNAIPLKWSGTRNTTWRERAQHISSARRRDESDMDKWTFQSNEHSNIHLCTNASQRCVGYRHRLCGAVCYAVVHINTITVEKWCNLVAQLFDFISHSIFLAAYLSRTAKKPSYTRLHRAQPQCISCLSPSTSLLHSSSCIMGTQLTQYVVWKH